jgi:MoxR-like ATPase
MSEPSLAVAFRRLDTVLNDIESVRTACAAFRDIYARLRAEVGSVLVGQDEVVNQALIALFADGHILLEGVPGLGKTLLVRTLGETLSLPFARIQFTPDVMPADITGTTVVSEDPVTGRRSFTFQRGPIFHQIILADEINRATPKSQAALLEAMQERSVTVGGHTQHLDRPFLVMATQNPIEQEGTYALPEAQLDRFLFKIAVPFTSRSEMNEIVARTTRGNGAVPKPILDAGNIIKAQRLARRIVVAPPVQDFAVRLTLATHPGSPHAIPSMEKYIAVGVSPRGAQALITAGKVRALVDGRYHVSFRDLADVAAAAMRHRIIASFEAGSDGITTDDIIAHLLAEVPRDGDE